MLLPSRPPRFVLKGVALAIGLVLGLVIGRGLAIPTLLSRTGSAARDLALWLKQEPSASAPAGAGGAADQRGLGVLLSWLDAEPGAAAEGEPNPSDGDPEEAPSAEGTQAGGRAGPRLGPQPPPAVYLQESTVIRLAESGAVPRGIGRKAAWGMPAGIEILDGAGLGIGWYPGDRLTHVEGVPVSDRSLVIQKVLERRAQGAKVISGTLARRTHAGVKSWAIIVEQPYLGRPTDSGSEEKEEKGVVVDPAGRLDPGAPMESAPSPSSGTSPNPRAPLGEQADPLAPGSLLPRGSQSTVPR